VADSYPGLTFATFGGNPVSTTAALATIQVIEEEDLRRNAAEIGAYLRHGLDGLKEKHPCVGDVRGMGLMQGLELVKDRTTKEPHPRAASQMLEETKRRGVLIGRGGLYANVIRTGMPLIASRAHVDELVAALDVGLAAVSR
jgi:4-aminobutyrate aminotransferase-like enzyme